MVKWIDANKELPKVKTITIYDEGEVTEWQESDPVLIKLSTPQNCCILYTFGRYEIDYLANDIEQAFWVDEDTGWAMENDTIIAWAPLEELE